MGGFENPPTPPNFLGQGGCLAGMGMSLPRSEVLGISWRSLCADETIAPADF